MTYYCAVNSLARVGFVDNRIYTGKILLVMQGGVQILPAIPHSMLKYHACMNVLDLFALNRQNTYCFRNDWLSKL